MLYIESEKDTVKTYRDWHVGEPFPEVDINFVTALQVDGDELTYLRVLYPINDDDLVVKITGADAQYMMYEGLKAYAKAV